MTNFHICRQGYCSLWKADQVLYSSSWPLVWQQAARGIKESKGFRVVEPTVFTSWSQIIECSPKCIKSWNGNKELSILGHIGLQRFILKQLRGT